MVSGFQITSAQPQNPHKSEMTEEVQDYDDELQELCAEIEGSIEAIKKAQKRGKSDPAQREKELEHINGRITRAKNVCASMKMEIRELSLAQAEPFNKKWSQYKENINQYIQVMSGSMIRDRIGILIFIQDLNWIAENANAPTKGPQPQKAKTLDEMTSDEILVKAKSRQEESIKTVDNMLVTIEETKGVATATAVKLNDQTNQLKEIGAQVEEVRLNLKQANRQLRAFARRLGTDKIFMGFMVLIVLGIVAIIIVKIVKKKTGSSSSADIFH